MDIAMKWAEKKLGTVLTCGFLVYQGDDHVCVCGSYHSAEMGQALKIPTVLIQSIVKLTVPIG